MSRDTSSRWAAGFRGLAFAVYRKAADDGGGERLLEGPPSKLVLQRYF